LERPSRAATLPHCQVEELQPRADEPLDRPAVEPREARELVVVGEVERGDDELEHLRVLVTQPVVLGRRKAELAAEAPQQLRVAAELVGEARVGRGRLDRLGEEQPERKRELARYHAARDVLERDAGVLEGSHESHDVDVRGSEEPVFAGREQPELLEPSNVDDRARN
jgi:hypothetical protein